MRVLGITGGIATGKSTVTRMLAELGAPTISADVLARELLAPGTATTKAVLAAFSDCADKADATGLTIDRRALSKMVFADEAARLRLESLTHPAIIAGLRAQVALWHKSGEAIAAAAEIPLLFEAGLEAVVDRIVVVACEEAIQLTRLQTRLGVGEVEARRQLAAQWPLTEKIARADVVITTDGALEDTRHQVEALWEDLI